MPDDPIIVTGGSLRVKVKDRHRLNEEAAREGHRVYRHSQDGKITRVTIDGKDFPANENSVIIIHYDVP